MIQLSLTNVSLERQNKKLLNNVTWQVNKGEHWAILGLNGSGKTSLLKLITAEYGLVRVAWKFSEINLAAQISAIYVPKLVSLALSSPNDYLHTC